MKLIRILFKLTSVKDVKGCVNYQGIKKSLKDMASGIEKGAKKQNNSSGYR